MNTSFQYLFTPIISLPTVDNVYIADAGNQRIRKITASNGIISTIAGSSTSGSFSGDGGDATAAELNNPYGVAVDSSGAVICVTCLLFYYFLLITYY